MCAQVYDQLCIVDRRHSFNCMVVHTELLPIAQFAHSNIYVHIEFHDHHTFYTRIPYNVALEINKSGRIKKQSATANGLSCTVARVSEWRESIKRIRVHKKDFIQQTKNTRGKVCEEQFCISYAIRANCKFEYIWHRIIYWTGVA